jgi:UDP-N-acetylglucosamine--dolichyl-phosphate N-acetylglucosaminephosphotransferase
MCFSAVAALLGFLVFNRYPARIFPGDSLTYTIGALIAVVAILGNMERVAFILFIPYFIEFFLKARTRFQAESFGVPDMHNRLRPMYRKVNSLTQIFMLLPDRLFNRKPKEYDIVLMMMLMELVFVLLVLLVF